MKLNSFAPLHAKLPHAAHLRVEGVPDGFAPQVVAEVAQVLGQGDIILCLRDAARQQMYLDGLKFFAPQLEVVHFPAWDCLPYDRVSPTREVSAQRLATLAGLLQLHAGKSPRVILTNVHAMAQKVVPRAFVQARALMLKAGQHANYDHVVRWLEGNGFMRSATVREMGEYAVRGGIIDLFPPSGVTPFRLDFFGATLESIRAFDVETQRTQGNIATLNLLPASELTLTNDTIKNFRQGYLAQFGGATRGDHLYEAISEGRMFAGADHWLPLFYEQMETLLDYVPNATLVCDHQVEQAAQERFAQIADLYESRKLHKHSGGSNATPYNPLTPEQLYLNGDDWARVLAAHKTVNLHVGHTDAYAPNVADVAGKAGRDFSPERAQPSVSVFNVLQLHIEALQEAGKTPILCYWSDGARDRLLPVLQDHGLLALHPIANSHDVAGLPKGATGVAILPLEHGYETDTHAYISEQDILGDRLSRPRRKTRKAEDFFSEISALTPGDIVVHADHGIGQFIGLVTLTVTGAPHDCLELHYAGGDKLYLPVENLDLLTRYGSEGAEAVLDRLGAGNWQARKAKMKQRIADMAHKLLEIAAKRLLRKAPKITPPEGAYEEFVARFPYEETEDQLRAIEDVLEDLAAGKPMDRLVCGDVGFGKTEVALRAAFAVALSGKQVAVVVPTTLLARQHYRTFAQRFAGLPVRVAQASRLVGNKELVQTRAELKDGTLDIVVGTHALLAKDIGFKDLGLLIIDEEQHFGVAHKERLKALRDDVHVLTLTATPIPRTLQLAFTGVRSLSIIASPPVDRLAVRTSILPYDALLIREALLRERYRGGQAFYVCPRIEDLDEIAEFLRKDVPEIRFQIAHGQMAPTQLEDIMTAFYEAQFDVLLSTTIVESGLDVPNANTLVIHRADMFGLAQLYQLRGRVGRSKTRAYALFTTPAGKKMTPQATRRLQVLESLDSLGAGFQLASHDLDIRGAGNLLGDEQSGHIREVGYELYQQMLTETIASLEAGGPDLPQEDWSPQINLGTSVLIPEDFVPDLSLRLSLYRRLSNALTEADIESFAAELIDRFGKLPPEVHHLLEVMHIKVLCRVAGIAKVDTGPKGIVLAFHNNTPPNTMGLVKFLATCGGQVKVRPDGKVVFAGHWPQEAARTKALKGLLVQLGEVAK